MTHAPYPGVSKRGATSGPIFAIFVHSRCEWRGWVFVQRCAENYLRVCYVGVLEELGLLDVMVRQIRNWDLFGKFCDGVLFEFASFSFEFCKFDLEYVYDILCLN